jgi:elongation factor P
MGVDAMIVAREIREGQALRVGGELYKVIAVTHHSATGQQSGLVKATVRKMSTGHVSEMRWAPDDRVEDVELQRVGMQYLYADEDEVVFMHPETFDQVSLPRRALERYLPFLKEGTTVHVQFSEGVPVDLDLPKTVVLTVSSCGAGIRGRSENTMKEAILENGMTILVPQFIQPGDAVLVDIQTGEYLERVRSK